MKGVYFLIRTVAIETRYLEYVAAGMHNKCLFYSAFCIFYCKSVFFYHMTAKAFVMHGDCIWSLSNHSVLTGGIQSTGRHAVLVLWFNRRALTAQQALG